MEEEIEVLQKSFLGFFLNTGWTNEQNSICHEKNYRKKFRKKW